jgi:zinc transporter ZupT
LCLELEPFNDGGDVTRWRQDADSVVLPGQTHHHHRHRQLRHTDGHTSRNSASDHASYIDGDDVVRSDGHGEGEEGSGGEGGHHHHHHQVPGSASAVALMVIMGDGLHNFTDGLAIGASFANSIAGGLGTTLAVFCHELPHELGDFAVLLTAGMSVKQALFYNVLSSVLAFLGMTVGVLVGNIGSTSSWIFSLTAGIFIYVSLVDMVPELTKTTASESDIPTRCGHLFLQVLGLTAGVAVMAVIALYEDSIQWMSTSAAADQLGGAS